jgi:hypothetical protein
LSSAFLDEEDLRRLTGYKRPAEQKRWLDEHGIGYAVNRLGRPVVRRDMDKSAVTEPELGPVP